MFWCVKVDFYDLLTAAGVDAQLVVVKGGSHGLSKPNQMPSRRIDTNDCGIFRVPIKVIRHWKGFPGGWTKIQPPVLY